MTSDDTSSLERLIGALSDAGMGDHPTVARAVHQAHATPVDKPLVAHGPPATPGSPPERADITKIREWEETEGHDYHRPGDPTSGWAWPAPPVCVESRIGGDLRAQILRNLGRPSDDDSCDVRLVERQIEGGWSEYTIENEYEIEVWIHDGPQAQQVWTSQHWSLRSSISSFIAWATTERPRP